MLYNREEADLTRVPRGGNSLSKSPGAGRGRGLVRDYQKAIVAARNQEAEPDGRGRVGSLGATGEFSLDPRYHGNQQKL